MGGGGAASDDDARVLEWELGLPGDDDLTPLSHSLVPPTLASAFRVSPVTPRTMLDVHLASQTTVSSLLRPLLPSFAPLDDAPDHQLPPPPPPPAADDDGDPSSARALKRPRLVWTPHLHKRFVDVVTHLGIESAVPKTIMQLMNVEGLSRENVASHLQKYRLYLKRMQGLSNEEPSSSSDHLFASTPVPQSLREPVQYAVPVMMPMHMYGMQQQQQ